MKNTPYWQKLKDPRWQKKRLIILERDGFKCRDCEDSNKSLNVHHCHYPWEISNELLLTVCEDCHAARQELEADGKRALALLFARLPNSDDQHDLLEFVTSLVRLANNSESYPVALDSNELSERIAL